MTEENFPCPECGKIVSRIDKFCRNCGANLTQSSETLPQFSTVAEMPTPPPYERKLSLYQRFYKLLIAPSEAMKDIALAPDYTGYFVIFSIQIILVIITVAVTAQKIQAVGPYATQVSSYLANLLALTVILGLFLYVLKWLVKSFIVRYAGDSGSNWNFTAAASVTAYAYIADIVFTVIGIGVLWFIAPVFHLNTADINIATQEFNDYRAQMTTLRVTLTLPLSLIGIAWKSYLGGLGTHFGTKEKCSISAGFVIFFALGLIGLLISFVINP